MFECWDDNMRDGKKNKDAPVLSIIIPTRNRMAYVTASIQSILSISSPDLELIIQDSSDSNDLEGWILSNIFDKRLRFNYSLPPVSMTENFNKAMHMSSGEYVCVIGDDDGVNPEIVEAAHWARDNELDALVPQVSASYCWPDFQSRYYGMRHAGKLYVKSFSGLKSYPDVDAEMRKCVLNAGQGTFSLPRVYFGLVRRQCLVEVYKKTGNYFHSVSPDVFSALAVANYSKRVCVLDYPLIVPGSSAASNAGRSAMGKHKGRLGDDPHMQSFQDLKWPEIVPAFFSVQTVWAEAAVEALQVIGRADLLRQFNIPLLHALCAVSHPDYLLVTIRSLYRALSITGRGYVRGTVQFVVDVCAVVGLRIRHIGHRLLYFRSRGKSLEFCENKNIGEAVQALSGYLRMTDRSFRKCV